MHEFEADAAAEEIVIGLVPEEELAQRERELEEARKAEEAENERRQAVREQAIREKEAAAKVRLLTERHELTQRLQRREDDNQDAAEAERASLHRVFKRAEDSLRDKLTAQHALVAERYGSLLPGRAAARQLRIEWNKLPQPVEFRVHKLRAVKNKLPSGRYVLLVTLYDRLGGNPMRWTKMGISGGGGDASRPGATTPVRHRGRFYDTELPFNQCVYAVAPSAVDLQPSHAFVFELFVLGGRTQPMDRVVAWSALPACDRDFGVTLGRFKLPLLRGEVDPAVTRYRGLETALSKDLDAWLGNLYVELAHLPRETVREGVTHREFDVELAASSELLRVRGVGSRRPVRLPAAAGAAAAGGGLRRRGGAGGESGAAGGLSDGAGDEDGSEGDEASEAGSDASEAEEGGREGLRRGGEVEEAAAGREEEDALLDGGLSGSLFKRGTPTSPLGAGGAGAMPAPPRRWGARGAPGRSAASAAGRDGEWVVREAQEREDVVNSGPTIIAEGVTRHMVMAVGPVQTASSSASASASGAASGPHRSTGGKRTPAPLSSVSKRGLPLTSASTASATASTGVAPQSSAGGGRGAGFLRSSAAGPGSPTVETAPLLPGGGTAAAATPAASRGAGLSPFARPLSMAAGTFAASRRGLTGGFSGAPIHVPGGTGAGAGKGTPAGGRTPGAVQGSLAGVAARGGRALGIGSPLGSPLGRGAASPAPVGGIATRAQASAALASASGSLSSFSYSLNKQEGKGLRGARVKESLRKLRFLRHEMVADLNPGSVTSFDFWVQLVLLLVALWLRIYIHYLGQWLYLRSLRIPVYDFTPLAYACTLKYVPDVLPNEVEIGEVLMGPVGVLGTFLIFVALSWLSQMTLGFFPEIPSRFIAYFGFAAVLDAPLIAIVDAAAGRYDCTQRFPACAADIASPRCTCSDGDAWKLYNRFLAEEGSGVVGVILTVFMYIVVALVALFLLYWYLLHLHLNGRMVDLFRRLHAEEDRFTVPHDFETSPSELQWIVSRAQRWRGPRGTTRKVAVCDYVLTDPLDPGFREVTTHLIIYHAALDGKRELYRHFLRLPDGTLLEVFGSMERQLGMASGMGTSALQDLLMAHGASGQGAGGEDGAEEGAFFRGL